MSPSRPPSRALALLVLALLLSSAPSHAARLLVREVKADLEGDRDTAAALTRVIETEVIRAAPDVEVLSWRAVAATMEAAEVADCLGDEETAACASEIGGALGVDLILSPHLSKLGSVRVLTVSVYRMGDATVAGQASRRTPFDDEDALLDASLEAVHEALHAAGMRVVAPPRLQSVQRVRPDDDGGGTIALPWLIAGGGVAAGALVAVVAASLHAGVLLAWGGPYQRGELDLAGARRWEREAPMWLTLPWLGYAGGAAIIAGALVGGWVLHE